MKSLGLSDRNFKDGRQVAEADKVLLDNRQKRFDGL
jgi:hypothetical protein